MNNSFKKLPDDVKPRERLLAMGAQSLSDYELLAIILRTGIKNTSVLDVSKNLIIKMRNLGNFNEVTIEELKNIDGIGKTKAIEILAAIEFGKRVCLYQGDKKVITSITEMYNYIRYDFENLSHEEIRAYYFDIKGNVLGNKLVGIGTFDSSNCDCRQIVKWALKLSSINLILVHNHPSGDCKPSLVDINFTKKIIEFCNNLDIKVIEHLVIGKNKYSCIIRDFIVDIYSKINYIYI